MTRMNLTQLFLALSNSFASLFHKKMDDTNATKPPVPTTDEVQRLLDRLMVSVNRDRGANFASE